MCQGKCQGPLLRIQDGNFALNACAPLATFAGPTQGGLAGRKWLTLSRGDLCLLRKHQEPTLLKITP